MTCQMAAYEEERMQRYRDGQDEIARLRDELAETNEGLDSANERLQTALDELADERKAHEETRAELILVKTTPKSIGQFCRESNIQGCSFCECADCGDNQNESILKLKRRIVELEAAQSLKPRTRVRVHEDEDEEYEAVVVNECYTVEPSPLGFDVLRSDLTPIALDEQKEEK